jgi:hypothetical protein
MEAALLLNILDYFFPRILAHFNTRKWVAGKKLFYFLIIYIMLNRNILTASSFIQGRIAALFTNGLEGMITLLQTKIA